MNFKRMMLTDFKIDIPRLARKKVLTAALEESGMNPLHSSLAAAQNTLLIVWNALLYPAKGVAHGRPKQRPAAYSCVAIC